MPRSFLVRKCLESKISSSSATENSRFIAKGTYAVEPSHQLKFNASKDNSTLFSNPSVGETGGILTGRYINLNRWRRLASFGESLARETEDENASIPGKGGKKTFA